MAVTSAAQLVVRERVKRNARGRYTKKKVSHPTKHPHFKDIEREDIAPDRVDPYTLHPDVYAVDVRGPMGTEVIIYDALMNPVERIYPHDGRRERRPYTVKPIPEIPRLLTRAMTPSRVKMRVNAKKKDEVLTAASLPNSSPRLMYSGIARKLNPGV